MSDSLIGQLAILLFLLLSSFMGRWLSRVARARRSASESEDLEGVRFFDTVPGPAQAASPNDTRLVVHEHDQQLVEAHSLETLQGEERTEPVLVASESTQGLNQYRAANRSEPERAIPGSIPSGRGKTLAGERQRPFDVDFQHPSDLRRAFKFALLLAPPRTLALDTPPDPSRFQP